MLEAMKTSEIVNHFYKPGIGAATYALKQVDALLQHHQPKPPDSVCDRVKLALGLFEQARGERYDYDNRKKAAPLRRQGAAEADDRVDRAVSTVYKTARGYLDFEESSEEHKLAAELIEGCFPNGVISITGGRYEEQHSKCNELVSRLRGPFARHVARLQLSLFVDNLEALNKDYGHKLTALNKEVVTYDHVRATEQAAIEAYFEAILTIWVAYLDDPATRSKLLSPVEEQNQRIARYYKRRAGAPTVDPDTGEVIDPDEAKDGAKDEESNEEDDPNAEASDDAVVEPTTPAE